MVSSFYLTRSARLGLAHRNEPIDHLWVVWCGLVLLSSGVEQRVPLVGPGKSWQTRLPRDRTTEPTMRISLETESREAGVEGGPAAGGDLADAGERGGRAVPGADGLALADCRYGAHP